MASNTFVRISRTAPFAAMLLLASCGSSDDEGASGATSDISAAAYMSASFAPISKLPAANTERYQHLKENQLKNTQQESVSTLSLDVDTGSYANVRRFIQNGQLPPGDAIRVEEMINYFTYSYEKPAADNKHPFAVNTEIGAAPWNPEHALLRVGIRALDQHSETMPPANLVFLVDVSGSMDAPEKLPLVKASLKMLVKQLRPQDRVSLIVYAGRTAMELPSTSGNEKAKILAAIERLNAGGATGGEAAVHMAYTEARAHFIKDGINRILLATDGDFNVGISDTQQLIDLVSRERETGITLTTLGFGTGNYNEAMLEQIADFGNGNYGYIDSLSEAKKVLVDELSSTFSTVASDVKIQIEFNPAQVSEWRLIGYENRVLREEDFKNDKVDAGDVGAGKSVTALYELTPVGKPQLTGERRYATPPQALPAAKDKLNEIAEVRVRYKPVQGEQSMEIRELVNGDANAVLLQRRMTTEDFRFAAAVSAFGQRLKGGIHLGNYGYTNIADLARGALGSDKEGYRRGFVDMVEMTKALDTSQTQRTD